MRRNMFKQLSISGTFFCLFLLFFSDLHPDTEPCQPEHAYSERWVSWPAPDTRGRLREEETLPAVPACDYTSKRLYHPLGPGSACRSHHLAHQLQQVSTHVTTCALQHTHEAKPLHKMHVLFGLLTMSFVSQYTLFTLPWCKCAR